MPEYFITWNIELEADDPIDAARKALEIHRNPESIATEFKVKEIFSDRPKNYVSYGPEESIDLSEIDDSM